MYYVTIKSSHFNFKFLCSVSVYFESLWKYEPDRFKNGKYITLVSSLDDNSVFDLLYRLLGPNDVYYNIELYYVVQLLVEKYNENMHDIFEFFDFICLKEHVYLKMIQGALDYILGRLISEEDFKTSGLFCIKFIAHVLATLPLNSTILYQSFGLLTSFMDKPTEELLNGSFTMHNDKIGISKGKLRKGLAGKFRSIHTTFQRAPHKCVFDCGLDLYISSYANFNKMTIPGCARTPCCGAIAHHHCVKLSTGRCPVCLSNFNRETGTVHGLLSMDGSVVAHDTLRIARKIYGIRMTDKVPMAIDTMSQLTSSMNHMVRFTRFRSAKWNPGCLSWTHRYQWRNPVPNFTFEYYY